MTVTGSFSLAYLTSAEMPLTAACWGKRNSNWYGRDFYWATYENQKTMFHSSEKLKLLILWVN